MSEVLSEEEKARKAREDANATWWMLDCTPGLESFSA